VAVTAEQQPKPIIVQWTVRMERLDDLITQDHGYHPPELRITIGCYGNHHRRL
jgi:hypothetical protein